MTSTPTTSRSNNGQNLSSIVAKRSVLSRRKAGEVIKSGRVTLNGATATLGDRYYAGDTLELDGKVLTQPDTVTIMLNKPSGYECSRGPQGNKPSVYELLPPEHQNLHHVGRLDADSSGLLLFTNDGQLSYELTHPKFEKQKAYQVTLDRPLADIDQTAINKGVGLDDGVSRMQVDGEGEEWVVTMGEGKNRQIRRTFAKLGYDVTALHRTNFGDYALASLSSGQFIVV